ncbi:MAG: manganese efflux pump [Bacillota bacterium]
MLSGIVWLLALAVSIDGFSAGLSCGLRKLVIPFPSLMVICCSSATAVAASMLLGGGIAQLIPGRYLAVFGGLLLIVIGLYVIYQNVVESNKADTAGPPFSLVLKPEKADLDHSGALSMKEALILGAALAADAFGAGFGAALIGAPLPATVLAVGLAKLVLFPLGVFCGRLVAANLPMRYPGFLGGLILIFIGMITIF